ncbi:Putative aminotransferase class V domain, kynureninase, pyridoxal phosphate-dependent transferase [Septoria linicola]|uniref:Kynureninase n=1 Tax=Septoria linicola TaxID=215465 RepID=A0A9Q9AT85_9PEZI|nr:putative aminotransferase class V domain, kynureninase, pyridoxal phosphate-dependent transferase [Septoria linicola]USW55387.1 Putative aminotransferase class V domain, kynureninase, pyridoxal phosphate-dependent transferase [Septoria linicola]
MEQSDIFMQAYAQAQDEQDPLRTFRDLFVIPTRADLARRTITAQPDEMDDEPSTYLCGNSLGLQPTLTREYFEEYLSTWARKGVYGHFKEVSDTRLPPWLHVDDDVRADMANVVGAKTEEVAVMQTLTANLHFLMCSFYRPTKEKHKILLEGKAFPSDHFAVQSQISHHGYQAEDSMILLEPTSQDSLLLTTEQILSKIDEHADSLALILLPGIQYYTGQLFDIKTITAHAHQKGILIGWDLAHAAGNVPLQLHKWDVDFACWCTYKYLNSGPGSIGGAFVHERHGEVASNGDKLQYRPRLSGWWGSSKTSRFVMANQFDPIPGAAGFQVSNTSVADTTAVRASLDVFKQTSMADLRAKSVKLTAYLEKLLDLLASEQEQQFGGALYHIITSRKPEERGAQLSVMLKPGLLSSVMEVLEHESVVLDERKPDVIRVAPAPLYNSFEDVWRFVSVFRRACQQAYSSGEKGESIMMDGGSDSKGWSQIK